MWETKTKETISWGWFIDGFWRIVCGIESTTFSKLLGGTQCCPVPPICNTQPRPFNPPTQGTRDLAQRKTPRLR